jgi:hypothetical protein
MKPTLKTPGKTPGKVVTATPAKAMAKDAALRAVKMYEEARDVLSQMRTDFIEQFPDANSALQEILRQEDTVQDLIKIAHPLVQAAKETIGDFECQRKWATAGYDAEKLTSLLKELDNSAEVMQELLAAGVIEKVVLSDLAVSYFAQHPEFSEAFKGAWSDKKEKTAAVTTPKI